MVATRSVIPHSFWAAHDPRFARESSHAEAGARAVPGIATFLGGCEGVEALAAALPRVRALSISPVADLSVLFLRRICVVGRDRERQNTQLCRRSPCESERL